MFAVIVMNKPKVLVHPILLDRPSIVNWAICTYLFILIMVNSQLFNKNLSRNHIVIPTYFSKINA